MRHIILFIVILCVNSCYALQIYAHRGGRTTFPENTLIAYKHALALGVDFVDMDVNMTKDGVLVVTHNYALNPDITQDKEGNWVQRDDILIKSLTLKQLKQYNVCQQKPGTDYAKMYPKQRGKRFCTMPTLVEAIHFVKQIAGNRVGFQIEIKASAEHPEWSFSPEALARAVAKVINATRITAIAEVQAFNYRCLLALQKIDPKIKTAYLTQFDSAETMLNPDPKIASLATGGPLLKNYYSSIPSMIAKLGGSLWDPQDVEITAAKVKQAHQQGLKVVVWNWPANKDQVFQPAVMNKLISANVDGIITDDPQRLRQLMKTNNLLLPSKIK